MKQIRIERFGVPSHVARCCESADPGEPSAWEVIVDIEAGTITPADIARLTGRYGELPPLPATPGLEAVGRIVARGTSVTEVAVGDRVIVAATDNWCQRRRLAATLVFKVPPELDVLQLAALRINACTALELVRRQAPLERGDWLVQTAPLSGVGRAVMQIARHDGLRTLNIVRRPDAIEQVLEAGGDAAIEDGPEMADTARKIVGNAPLLLAFDAVGGDGAGRIGELLTPGGTIISYGMLSGRPISIGCEQTIFRNISVRGFWLTPHMIQMPHALLSKTIYEAVDLLARGVLHTEVAGTYPLEAIGKAISHAEERGRRGKVYLLPNGPVHEAVAA